jgi:hypothetical protein
MTMRRLYDLSVLVGWEAQLDRGLRNIRRIWSGWGISWCNFGNALHKRFAGGGR